MSAKAPDSQRRNQFYIPPPTSSERFLSELFVLCVAWIQTRNEIRKWWLMDVGGGGFPRSRALDGLIKQRQCHFMLHHSDSELFLRASKINDYKLLNLKASELLFIAIRPRTHAKITDKKIDKVTARWAETELVSLHYRLCLCCLRQQRMINSISNHESL